MRVRVTERVLWSGAVNLNPVYQRLQWAAACVCVAASLLLSFACFVLPDARSIVASHTALTAALALLCSVHGSGNKSLHLTA